MPRINSPRQAGSRSNSPDVGSDHRRVYRRRSQSPRGDSKHSNSRRKHARLKKSRTSSSAELQAPVQKPITLPYSRGMLSKRQLAAYRPMFASYLDIQKQIDIDELSDQEIKGRWKSFVGKWNRGELAEGWYDPATLAKATNMTAARAERLPTQGPKGQSQISTREGGDSDDSVGEEGYGPALPEASALPKHIPKSSSGPTVPKVSDLALRDELITEDRAAEMELLRAEQKTERALQRQREEDLHPRAEPGTRERRLEKRAEIAASNRTFAQGRGKGEGGNITEVAEGELMGSGGGLEEVKRMRQREARKKNERELRREEILRARAAEREERLVGLREREEQTMSMLRAIAKERFGSDGGGGGGGDDGVG